MGLCEKKWKWMELETRRPGKFIALNNPEIEPKTFLKGLNFPIRFLKVLFLPGSGITGPCVLVPAAALDWKPDSTTTL